MVTRADELGGISEDLVGGQESGQSGKHAAGTLLAGQAVAQPDPLRLPVDLDTQLAATAGRAS
jgi:hypothetical protein